jgi:inosine/xanthosine triphosphatase
MKTIAVASANQPKIEATKQAFQKMFPAEDFEVRSVSVSSGVPDQPKGDDQTLEGAINRAENALKEVPGADFSVGIEGGIEEKGTEMTAFAWAAVLSKNGIIGKGRTAAFFLPPRVSELVRSGEELSHANDKVFGVTGSKHTTGAFGLLTGDILTRTNCYSDAVILALIPHKNQNLYKPL